MLTIFRPFSTLFFACIICIAASSHAQTTRQPHEPLPESLPELNDSASLVLNAQQEKMLGRQIMLQVRAKSQLSEDALLLDYLSVLAQRLAQYSPRNFGSITLNLAVDSDINAFAVPGAYITINTGLLEKTASEAELAAVIAHEIGHHSQRHIARRIERSKQISLPAAAALVGGLLIGGQVGLAAILSSNAAVGADQLAYSRNFEREADASGIQILYQAGYAPSAMPKFFSKLEAQSRLYGGNAPPFLLTHPISSDRIADGLSRAKNLSKAANGAANKQHNAHKTANSSAHPTPLRLDYSHAKARSIALYSDSAEQSIDYFAQSLRDKATLSARYGLFLAQLRKNDWDAAISTLSYLRKTHPNQTLITFSQAELNLKRNLNAIDAKIAWQNLTKLQSQHPKNAAAANAYALSLIKQQDYAQASLFLRKALRQQPNWLWAYELLAQSYGAENKTLNAVFIQAQQWQFLGQYSKAIKQLKTALNSPHQDKTPYLTASIKDLLKQNEQAKRALDAFTL